MDIRIEKTDRAIEKAFMELRARQPLEKIRIKDLCTLAKVNKSTFYAHYEDIYELSSRLENKLIHVILDSVPNVGLTAAHTEQLTRELFHAFVQNQELKIRVGMILFSLRYTRSSPLIKRQFKALPSVPYLRLTHSTLSFQIWHF